MHDDTEVVDASAGPECLSVVTQRGAVIGLGVILTEGENEIDE